VGIIEGFDWGISVGVSEGFAVGDELGVSEGCAVGDELGINEGEVVGASVRISLYLAYMVPASAGVSSNTLVALNPTSMSMWSLGLIFDSTVAEYVNLSPSSVAVVSLSGHFRSAGVALSKKDWKSVVGASS